MSIGGMISTASPAILFNQTEHGESQYLPYALAALPYLLTSFGYHGNVPGLVKYYNKDSRSVVKIWGYHYRCYLYFVAVCDPRKYSKNVIY